MTPLAPTGKDSRIPLAEACRGSSWRVVAIAETDASELLAEGLVTGTIVVPENQAPFRGPVIVRVGRARVAVARSVAGRVLVASVGSLAGGDR